MVESNSSAVDKFREVPAISWGLLNDIFDLLYLIGKFVDYYLKIIHQTRYVQFQR